MIKDKFEETFSPGWAESDITDSAHELVVLRKKEKAANLSDLLNVLEKQTVRKPAGDRHINDRIVSLDDPDARPV
ncbi:hypothetical protein QUF90_23025 [Desulfococcaceae bacterium HSG9]|nr:hypothetical protein [Desulfococcaceae bacterium HSG9]